MTTPTYIGRLKWKDKVVGTGFIVAKDLIATCYHVLRDATESPLGQLFEFENFADNITCQVILMEDKYNVEKDVALLRVIGAPLDVSLGRLVRSALVKAGNQFHTSGHGKLEDKHNYAYHPATGTVTGFVNRDTVQMVQLDSKQVLRGMSGGPVIVDELGGIIGLISARYTIDPKNDLWMRDTVWVATSEALVELAPTEISLSSPRPLTLELPDGNTHLKIFLSSTSRDLAEHREAFIEQCRLRGYSVIAMEEFGAQDAGAIDVSLKEIEPCELFIGVYAKRYGHIPEGHLQSFTELEYHEAVKLEKPRLIFVVDDEQPLHELINWNRDDKGEAAKKLSRFLNEIGKERVWDRFTSPEDFAIRAITAVSKWEGWRNLEISSPPQNLIGRAVVIAQIKQHLIETKRLAVIGIGGIGKTALIQYVISNVSMDYPGGIYWASLGAETKNADALLSSLMARWATCHPIGRLVDTRNLTTFSIKRWLSEAPGKQLFVIDDVWHIRAAQQILLMIPDDASIIFTTRQADSVRQLGVDRILEIESLSEEASIDLLRKQLGTMPTTSSLREISRILNGHPLALEIAVAQIVKQGVEYADKLPKLFNDQAGPNATLKYLQMVSDERDKSIEISLGLTYTNLTPDLKRRFRVIGNVISETSIPFDLLQFLWKEGESELQSEDTQDRINALIDNGIISVNEVDKTYRMHRLLFVYARALLGQEEQRASLGRYIEYCLHKVEHIFGEPQPNRSEIELYLPHIQYAVDILYAAIEASYGDLEHLAQPTPRGGGIEQFELRMLESLSNLKLALQKESLLPMLHGAVRYINLMRSYILATTSLEKSGLKWLWMGTAAANILADNYHYGLFLNDLAEWYYDRGQTEFAMDYWNLSRRKFRWIKDKSTEAWALTNRAIAYHEIGHSESAINFLNIALSAAEEAGDSNRSVEVLCQIARILTDLKDYQGAEKHLDQAKQLNQEKKPLLNGYIQLGFAYLQQEINSAEALIYTQTAIDCFVASGNYALQATALEMKAQLLAALNRNEQALVALKEALVIYQARAERKDEARLRASMGLATMNDLEVASGYIETSLRIYQEIGFLPGEGETQVKLGKIYAHHAMHEPALLAFERALRISFETQSRRLKQVVLYTIPNDEIYRAIVELAEELEAQAREEGFTDLPGYNWSSVNRNQYSEPNQLWRQALVSYQSGDHDFAKTMLEAALEEFSKLEIQDRIAQILMDLGKVMFETGDIESSITRFNGALNVWRELGESIQVAKAYYWLGKSYEKVASIAEAQDCYLQALELYTDAGQKFDSGITASELGYLNRHIGQSQEAIKFFEEAVNIFEMLGDRKRQIDNLRGMAVTYLNLVKDIDKGKEYLNSALEISNVTNNRSIAAEILADLGRIEWSMNRQPLKAIDLLRRAVEKFEETSGKKEWAEALYSIGEIYWDIGEIYSAIEIMEKAIPLFEQSEEYKRVAVVLDNIGQLYKRLNELDKTYEYYQRALRYTEQNNLLGQRLSTLNQLAGWYWDTKNFDKAKQGYLEVISQAAETGYSNFQATSLNNLATLHEEMGETLEAFSTLQQITPLLENLSQEHEIKTREKLITYFSRFGQMGEAIEQFRVVQQMRLRAGDTQGARTAEITIQKMLPLARLIDNEVSKFSQSLKIAEEGEDVSQQAKIKYSLAQFFLRLNLHDAALLAYQQSADLFAKIPEKKSQAIVFMTIANIYETQERWKDWLKKTRSAVELLKEINDLNTAAEALFSAANMCARIYQIQDQTIILFDELIAISKDLNDKQSIAMGLVMKSQALNEWLMSHTDALPIAKEALQYMQVHGIDKDKIGQTVDHYEHNLEKVKALQEKIDEGTKKSLLQLALNWVITADWAAARDFYVQHQDQFKIPFAYFALEGVIDILRKQNSPIVEKARAYQRVLRWAQEVGIDGAIERMQSYGKADG